MSDWDLDLVNYMHKATGLQAMVPWPQGADYPLLHVDGYANLYGPVLRLWASDGVHNGDGVKSLGASSSNAIAAYGGSLGNGGVFHGGMSGVLAFGKQVIGVAGYTESPNTTGVHGNSSSPNGINYGVFGFNGSELGAAVRGDAHHLLGTGVQGTASGGDGVQGFTGSSDGKSGVWGHNQSSWGVGYGVAGSNSSNLGAGVFGRSTASAPGVLGTGNDGLGVRGESTSNVGVSGLSVSRNGVSGMSTSGFGAQGTSKTSHGVVGDSASADASGVWGFNPRGAGVRATSFRGFGIYAQSDRNYGILAYSKAARDASNLAGVCGLASRGIGVAGQITDANATDAIGVYGAGPNAAVFEGNVTVHGNLTVTSGFNLQVEAPGNKNGVVELRDGSRHLVCAIESPEAWFEDFGESALTKGEARVKLDTTFAAVVDTSRYHVFLSPYGKTEGLYVARRGRDSFVVRGLGKNGGKIAFSWRVVARPKAAKSRRFAKAKPSAPAPSRQPGVRAAQRKRNAMIARVPMEPARPDTKQTIPTKAAKLAVPHLPDRKALDLPTFPHSKEERSKSDRIHLKKG
jgi:hypothetical protein